MVHALRIIRKGEVAIINPSNDSDERLKTNKFPGVPQLQDHLQKIRGFILRHLHRCG